MLSREGFVPPGEDGASREGFVPPGEDGASREGFVPPGEDGAAREEHASLSAAPGPGTVMAAGPGQTSVPG